MQSSPHIASDLIPGILLAWTSEGKTTVELPTSEADYPPTSDASPGSPGVGGFPRLLSALRTCLHDEDPEVCAQALSEVLPSVMKHECTSPITNEKKAQLLHLFLAIDGDIALMQAAQLTKGLISRAASQAAQVVRLQIQALQLDLVPTSILNSCESTVENVVGSPINKGLGARSESLVRWFLLPEGNRPLPSTSLLDSASTSLALQAGRSNEFDLEDEVTEFGQEALDCY